MSGNGYQVQLNLRDHKIILFQLNESFVQFYQLIIPSHDPSREYINTVPLTHRWAIFFCPRAVSKIFSALRATFSFRQWHSEWHIKRLYCKNYFAGQANGLSGPDVARGPDFAHPCTIWYDFRTFWLFKLFIPIFFSNLQLND